MPTSARHPVLAQVARPVRRPGVSLLFVVGSLCAVGIVAVLVWYSVRARSVEEAEAPLLKEVVRGPYEHTVLQKGEVESGNNVEIRCEVRARNTYGPSTTILEVIPEGTWVKENDWLVTFDSSALEQEQRQQKIAVNTSEAVMIQAKAAYDTALISKKEYLEGTYREQEQTILNELFVAEENLKKAQLSYDSVKRLVARGLLTSLQLEGEKFRVDAATNDLQLAKRKLEVLEKYTKVKMVTQLDSDIQAAEVKWKNEQDSYQEEVQKLKEIDDQIAKCRVVAPQEGQVVYANVQSSRSGSEFVVEAGAAVRENQVVIILPDPRNMQIKAKINESKINLVEEGLPVTIRIDAFGEQLLQGTVTKVNNYAEPGNWWSSSAKQYATFIKVIDPPPELRVGLTAEVQIHVEHRNDALQVPVQAVFERGGKTFCLVQRGSGWDTREIAISSTNAKTVALDEQVSEPLREGEMVVINPRQHVAKFDASRLPPPTATPPRPAVVAEAKSAAASQKQADTPVALQPVPREGVQAATPDTKPAPAVSVDQWMRQYDADRDGRLSGSEVEQVPADNRRLLASADTNKDGMVDTAELVAALTGGPDSGNAPAVSTGGGG